MSQVLHPTLIKGAFAGDKQFQMGDLVLKWDKVSEASDKHSNIPNLWLGPYEIIEKIGDSTYHLQSL